MAKLEWDKTGERTYEAGTSKGVLYPTKEDDGSFSGGVAWNGLTAVNESPSGAEPTPLGADDQKYANMMSAEEFAGSIEGYTYPEEFGACIGEKEIAPGVVIGQQNRTEFGFCYRTLIGNDTDGLEHGYKLHLVYNALAGVAERGYTTVNDSPEAITFSWEFSTTPVAVSGSKPTACLTIDSTKADATKLAALEAILYGDTNTEPRLPLPDEVAELLAA